MKKIMALLFALLLVLVLIPASVMGETVLLVIANDTINLADGLNYYKNDGSIGSADDYNYYYDREKETLYLNNCELTYAGDYGAFLISSDLSKQLVINIKGICVINSENAPAFSIQLGENAPLLKFTGGGTLKVNGMALFEANNQFLYSRAQLYDNTTNIMIDDVNFELDLTNMITEGNFNLDIKTTKLKATLNSDGRIINGILLEGYLGIDSSEIEVVMNGNGDTVGAYSYIKCNNSLKINNSKITLSGNGQFDENYPDGAILIDGNIAVQGNSKIDIDDEHCSSGLFAKGEISIKLTKNGKVRTHVHGNSETPIGMISVDLDETGNYNQGIFISANNKITTPARGKIKTVQPEGKRKMYYTEGSLDELNMNVFEILVPKNPDTGDNYMLFITAGLILTAGCGIVLIKKKHKE